MAENGTVIKGTSGKIKEIKFPDSKPTPKAETPQTTVETKSTDKPTPMTETPQAVVDTKSTDSGQENPISTENEAPLKGDDTVSEEQATVIERDWTGAESFAYNSHLLPMLVALGGGGFMLYLLFKKKLLSCETPVKIIGAAALLFAFAILIFMGTFHSALTNGGVSTEPALRTQFWVFLSPALIIAGILLPGFHFYQKKLTLLIFLLLPLAYQVQAFALFSANLAPSLSYVLLSLAFWLSLGYAGLFYTDLHRNRHFLHPKVKKGAVLIFGGLAGSTIAYIFWNLIAVQAVSNEVRIIFYNLTDVAVFIAIFLGIIQIALSTSVEEAEEPKLRKERKPAFAVKPKPSFGKKPKPSPSTSEAPEPSAEPEPAPKPASMPKSKPAAPPPPPKKKREDTQE